MKNKVIIDGHEKHRKTSYNPNIWMHTSVEPGRRSHKADKPFETAVVVLSIAILLTLIKIFV